MADPSGLEVAGSSWLRWLHPPKVFIWNPEGPGVRLGWRVAHVAGGAQTGRGAVWLRVLVTHGWTKCVGEKSTHQLKDLHAALRLFVSVFKK